jgi:hypothetical protein
MFALKPHPDHPPVAAEALRVHVERLRYGFLLSYFLSADTSRLVIPPYIADAPRTDGLWRSTCFEAFVRGGGKSYCEFNFSPSGEWASYAFDGYREGMHETPTRARILTTVRPHMLAVGVHLNADFDRSAQMALAAVIEETDGRKSYWALEHPSGAPDFHDAACFAVQLESIARR